jgi:hypothetical protein
MKIYVKYSVIMSMILLTPGVADNKKELAEKLANPLSSIVSIPIQANYYPNLGVDDKGSKWVTNIQPVVPVTLNDEWNLLVRTIIPLISQDTGIPSVGTIDGVGDVLLTTWLSPKAKTESGWIWGAGAVFLLPLDTDVSAKKWGAGPSAVAIKSEGHVTYGMLANHVWSYAGSDAVTDEISSTLLQPFTKYVTDNAMTFALSSESTYDWVAEEWTVPVTVMVSKLVHIGKLPVNVGIGATHWLEAPEYGPDGWGIRLAMTFILPKRMFGLK